MRREPDWKWHLEEDHWIELFLTWNGLDYTGWDVGPPYGGAYMAGFQSFEVFLRDGGLQEMPDDVAREVRARIAELPPGHLFRIELAGPVPDEAHLELDGQALILARPEVLFEGSLPPGGHCISGVLLYPGADERGRRNARRFEQDFEVTGPGCLRIEETEPRWG